MIQIRQTMEFADWFSKLRDRNAQKRIQARIDRMEIGNLGDCEPIGHGISEARIHYGAGYRIYFIQRDKILIVLLVGGDKSTQRRDIARAIKLAEGL